MVKKIVVSLAAGYFLFLSALPVFAQGNAGINMSNGCMTGAGCSFDVTQLLGLKKNSTSVSDRTSVLTFVQDAVLAVTMFIGTVVTIAFVYAGFQMVSAGMKGKDPSKAKTGMINAAIGMLLVASSYAIIRLVQYIAAG